MADRIRNSSGLDKAALAQDFKSNPALLKAMNDEPELVDIWKGVSTSSRKNPSFLKAFKNEWLPIKNNLIGHLKGTLNRSKDAVGGHIDRYVDGINVRYRGTKGTPNSYGVYEADIDVFREIKDRYGNTTGTIWVEKAETSTFFPANLSDDEIFEQIVSAYNRKTVGVIIRGKYEANAWKGTSDIGFEIGGFFDKNTLTILQPTAFPFK